MLGELYHIERYGHEWEVVYLGTEVPRYVHILTVVLQSKAMHAMVAVLPSVLTTTWLVPCLLINVRWFVNEKTKKK